mgnify:CR=1 FL=1
MVIMISNGNVTTVEKSGEWLIMMNNNTSKQLKDSHKKSVSESIINSLGGFPIAYGIGILILPLSTGWIQSDPFVANIAITGTYATVSFVRSYFLRRIFEQHGIDDNFIRVGIKFVQKMTRRRI